MGRTKPSATHRPQAYRKDARAKKAKATINKVIPALLNSNSRAHKAVIDAELIVDPPQACATPEEGRTAGVSKAIGTGSRPAAAPKVRIAAVDTITAALRLFNDGQTDGKVGVLNMASPLRPGGGFLNGATSQEEFLCMRTTLYPSLQDNFYRLPDIGGVWTPDVLIFRDGSQEATDLEKRQRKYVGVVSSAMLRFPDLHDDGESYASQKDKDMVTRKTRAVMRTFQSKHVTRVVLGAWGCGAYGNPVKEVARSWRKVLLGERTVGSSVKELGIKDEGWDGVKDVVFAINEKSMAEEFAKYFGDDVGVEYEEESTDKGQLNAEDESVQELNRRIAELEIQIPQARTAVLKSRLEEILAGLQHQQTTESKSD